MKKKEKMAGTYTKKEFGAGPEEQTLLNSNGTRIVPAKGNGTFASVIVAIGNAAVFLELLFRRFIFPCIPAQTSL